MSEDASPSLVSAAWLKDNITSVKILDGTWYMPNVTDKNALKQYTEERIPGAQYFDLDQVADKSTGLPHMLPSEAQFAAAADALGISNDDFVVIYDRSGIFSAPRAWWTWHVFIHKKVAVLDGGLPAWKAAGGQVDTTPIDANSALAPSKAAQAPPVELSSVKYKAHLKQDEVRSLQQVLANIESKTEQVVDARPAGRWRGEAPEPRAGLRLGHIPGSSNVPWDSVLCEGKFKPVAELEKIFKDNGLEVGKQQAVFSCGSGTTACILALAAKQIDRNADVAIYDGSWSEYGASEEVPVGTAISK